MGKIALIFVAFLFVVNASFAQEKILVAEGTSPNLYISHTLQPKENYYSIGRLYNVPPKEIAPYNNLDFDKALNIGQVIKVPLTQANFLQNQTAENDEALVPVYHIVKPKEGLYRVSVNYNKVLLEKLKQWNHLSSDEVTTGDKIVIGFLKVQKSVSPLASNAVAVSTVAKNEEKKIVPDAPKETSPAVKNPDVTPDKKEKEPVVAKEKDDAKKTIDTVKVPLPAKKEETQNNTIAKTSINFNGGKFKTLYDDQHGQGKNDVTENGMSGVFKSTSGWKDGKYYCFNNNAQPGTIVKITNTENGKSVYAKVLDLIPDITQNSGLVLHVSNAAAEELGVSNNKFDCSVTYSK